MNKTVFVTTVFMLCLTQFCLSSNMRGSADRELGSISFSGGMIYSNGTSTVKPVSKPTTVPISIPIPVPTPTPVQNVTSNTGSSTVTVPATSTVVVNTTVPSATVTVPVPVTTTPAVNNTTDSTATKSPTIAANITTPEATIPAAVDTPNNTVGSNTPVATNTTTSSTASPVATDTTSNVPSGSSTSDSGSSTTTPVSTAPVSPTPAFVPANVKRAKNDVNRATFASTCLYAHNLERSLVGVPPLVWSDSLAADSQAWAEDEAVNGFRHSGGKYGENISSTTFATKTLDKLLNLWIKEKYHYIVGCKYGKCSTNKEEVGHYTQMVWSKTTEVGCGFAPGISKMYNYLVCRYLRAGNVIGQTVYPV